MLEPRFRVYRWIGPIPRRSHGVRIGQLTDGRVIWAIFVAQGPDGKFDAYDVEQMLFPFAR